MEYTTLEQVKIRLKQFHIDTVTNDDETTSDYPNHKYLKFWSIPSSFKIIKDENHHQIYEFKAIIEGTEPRKNKENHTPKIVLNCKLEYEI